jgi:hypothetical protein
MSLIAKVGESKFEPISEGVHVATCIAVIDLGEQYSTIYDNVSHKALLTFELHDETVKVDGEEKNRFTSKEYTVSLGEKANLRKDLESWRGKKFTDAELQGFDLKNVLGKSCQVQILHREKAGKTYADISTIMSMPKGMQAPSPQSELIYFDFDDMDFEEKLAKLPEWIRTKITGSETYKKLSEMDFQADEPQDMEQIEGKLPWEK